MEYGQMLLKLIIKAKLNKRSSTKFQNFNWLLQYIYIYMCVCVCVIEYQI
jgi:hypothetical protein